MNIDMLRELWQDSFGDTAEFLDSFFTTAFHPDRCHCITVSGKILGALYWFDCLYQGEPLAYLYAIATHPDYRNQGICRRLMQETHQYLAQQGYQGAILVPGNKELFSFYEKLGYQTCCSVSEFHCTSSTKKITITEISKEQYAEMRRHYLPTGGVIQEKENLEFLQTQAHLYHGDNFLLAAHKDTNSIMGMELLGDTTTAPDIVHTLGCAKGSFRTPGKETPFAMYYPLTDRKLAPPEYFGLAFD